MVLVFVVPAVEVDVEQDDWPGSESSQQEPDDFYRTETESKLVLSFKSKER
jgi:hypothetical protein